MIDSSFMPHHRPLVKLHFASSPFPLPLCTWATANPQKRPQYRNTTHEPDTLEAEKFQEQQLEQPHHQLVASYDSLNRKYSELLDEFKSLRRYFSVSVSVPYTDVWTHKPVQFYPGKHPCEKPADMLRQIINASSRPGDLVADFFMGSGSTIKAAMALGRRALGVELESERFNQTVKEVSELVGK